MHSNTVDGESIYGTKSNFWRYGCQQHTRVRDSRPPLDPQWSIKVELLFSVGKSQAAFITVIADAIFREYPPKDPVFV